MADNTNQGSTTEIDYRIPAGSKWDSMWKLPLGFFAIGALLFAWSWMSNAEMAGYAYLFAFFSVLTVVLGAMFIVIILPLTGGHWGVSSRRIAENLVWPGAPLVALLFLPLAIGVATGSFSMYDEWLEAGHHGAEHADDHGDDHGATHSDAGNPFAASRAIAQHGDGHGHGAAGAAGTNTLTNEGAVHGEHEHTKQEVALHHKVIEHKAPYLNGMRWFISAFFYLLIWVLIGRYYFKQSAAQDKGKDPQHTLNLRKWAPMAAIGFGLTLTFASFDWLMALEPAWYSTIFGVIIFGGSVVAIFALLIIIGMSLATEGLIGKAINVEHFHDLGKMMFGFMCFWAYVSFSQWMLIWYAGIPEESTWFQKRWTDGWQLWSLLLIFMNFAIPFYFLISRITKRNLRTLRFGAWWLFAMHFADIYYFVKPQAGPLGLGLIADVAALFCVGGLFFAGVFYHMRKHPLIPVGDPLLARSIDHHQSY